jgi:hypothetical protein
MHPDHHVDNYLEDDLAQQLRMWMRHQIGIASPPSNAAQRESEP